MWARVSALLYGAWGRPEESGKGQFRPGGGQPVRGTLPQAKLSAPRPGTGDNPQEGSVGRGVEGREVGKSSTSLNLAKAFCSGHTRGHAHTHTPLISFLSRCFVPLHALLSPSPTLSAQNISI